MGLGIAVGGEVMGGTMVVVVVAVENACDVMWKRDLVRRGVIGFLREDDWCIFLLWVFLVLVFF